MYTTATGGSTRYLSSSHSDPCASCLSRHGSTPWQEAAEGATPLIAHPPLASAAVTCHHRDCGSLVAWRSGDTDGRARGHATTLLRTLYGRSFEEQQCSYAPVPPLTHLVREGIQLDPTTRALPLNNPSLSTAYCPQLALPLPPTVSQPLRATCSTHQPRASQDHS